MCGPTVYLIVRRGPGRLAAGLVFFFLFALFVLLLVLRLGALAGLEGFLAVVTLRGLLGMPGLLGLRGGDEAFVAAFFGLLGELEAVEEAAGAACLLLIAA